MRELPIIAEATTERNEIEIRLEVCGTRVELFLEPSEAYDVAQRIIAAVEDASRV